MEYHYLLGVALMQAGDMPSAVFALQDALALEPNRAVTLVALGLAFNSQKLYAEAKAPLLRSLEIEPDRPRGPRGARRVGGRRRRSRVGRDARRARARAPARQRDRQPRDGPRAHEAGALSPTRARSWSARSPPTRCPAERTTSSASPARGSATTAGQEKHIALYRSVQQEVARACSRSCAARAPGRARG